jgi:hypothetical protein
MSSTADWERACEDFLAAALVWVRLLLEQRVRAASATLVRPQPATSAIVPPDKPEGRWRPFRPSVARDAGAAAPQPVAALPAAPVATGPDDIAAAAAALAAAEDTDPSPAFVLVARRFGLTDFERNVLLLCVAAELDPSVPELCGRAQGATGLDHPTFGLAFELFDHPTWEPLRPDRPLRHFNLIEIYQPPGTPLTRSILRADERVIGYVKSATFVDDALTAFLVSVDEHQPGIGPPPSQAGLTGRIVAELAATSDVDRLPVVQLVGSDAPTKQLIASRAADALGLHLYRLPTELLPVDAGELERLTRLWQRESVLIPIAMYLDAYDDRTRDHATQPIARFLARSGGVVFVDTDEVVPTYGRSSVVVDVAQPTAAEQAEVWRLTLGPAAGDAPERLAGQFDLGVPTIERIARAAAGQPDDRSIVDRAWSFCLAETRSGLDALAQRIDPKATWDEIILPEAEMRLLRRIADQVGYRSVVYQKWGFANKTSRGLGINALFAGPSGTGKTMAAEVIANHLRLNLYRIDLSAVVSKYIGETEKNLARLFQAAEAGGVVLFFDEADALFGKRTEIRDSHDRYANIEINYLLQRMEAFRGLAILATNRRSALDTAFLRRLRFVVDFPYPSTVERRRIWQRVFPAEASTEGLLLDRLAKLNFTGGDIHNVAINAAFLAAHDGTAVTMPHVLEAARAETRKLERPVDEREFEFSSQEVA